MSHVTLRTAWKGETPPIMQMQSETFSNFSDTKMWGKCVPCHSGNVIDEILSLSCSVLSHDFLSHLYWNSKFFYSLSGYARSGSLLLISLIRSLKKTDLRFFYIDLFITCLPTRMEVPGERSFFWLTPHYVCSTQNNDKCIAGAQQIVF